MVRLAEVRDSFDRICREKNRDGQVELMAVSKLHTYENIMECYDQGQRLFGENHVQEIAAKFPPREERPDGMFLAIIGHLQKNKVRKVIPLVDRIDSVDSVELLLLIEKELARVDRCMPILFELNSSNEEQKSGFSSPEELMKGVDALELCPHVTLSGIMTVGPLGNDEERNRSAFRLTRFVFEDVKKRIPSCNILSMGMSGDYWTAIEEGSTLVRIGTAIFGERNYNA